MKVLSDTGLQTSLPVLVAVVVAHPPTGRTFEPPVVVVTPLRKIKSPKRTTIVEKVFFITLKIQNIQY